MRVRGKRYSVEFRADAVALVERGDRSVKQLSHDLGVSEWTLRHWYDLEEMKKRSAKKRLGGVVSAGPKSPPATAAESAEEKAARLERKVTELERENETLRMDRES